MCADPEHREREEPEQGDRSEHDADASSAAALNHEQADQNADRDRDDEAFEPRCRDLEPFDRAEHGDRRRDHAVAVEQRCAEQAEHENDAMPRSAAGRRLRRQRHQGQDSAFAAVVGAKHVGQVLERDHDRERPEDQRKHAEHVVVDWRHGVRAVQALAKRVQRAGTDVAEHDAERGQRQRQQRVAVVLLGRLRRQGARRRSRRCLRCRGASGAGATSLQLPASAGRAGSAVVAGAAGAAGLLEESVMD